MKKVTTYVHKKRFVIERVAMAFSRKQTVLNRTSLYILAKQSKKKEDITSTYTEQ